MGRVVIGMEYALFGNNHFALEYSYFSRELEGDSTNWLEFGPNESTIPGVESNWTGTRTRIVLRDFF